MLVALALLLQSAGEQLYLAGRFDEALRALTEEIRGGKATPRTHFWLGYTHLALGNKPAAIEPFETYLSASPGDEDVLYAVAKTYAQLAEMSLERIFALDPQSARAWQMRGIRFELEQEWNKALEAYERALRTDPGLRGVWLAIARIQEKELRMPDRARQARLKEPKGPPPNSGVALLEKKQPAGALSHLTRWRAAAPQDPNAYYYLGEAYTDLKVATIQRLRAAHPASYRLHQVLAENYASIHKKDEAVAEYRQVLKLQPELPGVHYELARLLTDSAPQEARALLEKELAVDPAHYLAKSLLGQVLVALRESANAIPLLQDALDAKDSMPEARRALGKALLDTGNAEAALPHLERVAREKPDDDQVHFLLAQAYRALGKPQEAAREMQVHQSLLRRVAGQ